MLALALSAVMVSGMTAMSIEAQEIYARARARESMISMYEAHAAEFEGLLPSQTRSISYPVGTTTGSAAIVAKARWYGNDRIETDIEIKEKGHSVAFTAVRKYPFISPADAEGTPLCSPKLGSTTPAITPIVLPINPLLPLTDIEVRNRIAYISIDSSVSADPDLIIADIADPKNPKILSVLNTGPGIKSIALAGKYIFAAAASAAAQLHVIRLDSLAAPALVKKYQLPLPAPSTTPPMGSSISYRKGIAYLGTEKWDGNELSTIDVAVPSIPKMLGGMEIGSKVNDSAVRGDLAYVANASPYQLETIDAKDPAHPVVAEAFSPSGWARQEGEAASSFEDTHSLGRTSGGFDIASDHEAFMWPATSSMPVSMNMPGGVYGIIAGRDHAYLATRTVNKEFAVLNSSLSSSSAAYYSLPVSPQAMTCDLDRLYILAHSAPALYEITF